MFGWLPKCLGLFETNAYFGRALLQKRSRNLGRLLVDVTQLLSPRIWSCRGFTEIQDKGNNGRHVCVCVYGLVGGPLFGGMCHTRVRLVTWIGSVTYLIDSHHAHVWVRSHVWHRRERCGVGDVRMGVKGMIEEGERDWVRSDSAFDYIKLHAWIRRESCIHTFEDPLSHIPQADCLQYRVVLAHNNWQIKETAGWIWAGFFTEDLETRWQRFGQFLNDL